MFRVIDYIINSWFHRKIYEEYHLFCASTAKFSTIFEAFLLPGKFLVQYEIYFLSSVLPRSFAR